MNQSSHNVGLLSEGETIAETLIFVDGMVNKKQAQCLIDTGSSVSMISPHLVPDEATISPFNGGEISLPFNGGEIRAVSDEKLPIIGQIRTQMKINAIKDPIWVKLLVAYTNGFDCLLGNNLIVLRVSQSIVEILPSGVLNPSANCPQDLELNQKML